MRIRQSMETPSPQTALSTAPAVSITARRPGRRSA